MAYKSKIEWTETTWNPVTGCTKISKGCMNCYAEKLALRLKAMGVNKYKNAFDVSLHYKELLRPQGWKEPRRIFVNSMGDLFHDDVPLNFIEEVFTIMNKCQRHIFQILTKRSERLMELSDKLPWSQNIWMGVTVEDNRYLHRIKHLSATDAHIKFISFEPLLSDMLDLELSGIHWAIVGGESGPGSRVMKSQWVEQIKNTCMKSDIPFFFKQWGGTNKHKNGRLFDGKIWDCMPEYQISTLSA
ncbi:DUF5131 family protein [Candidatus Magnetomonas plexicatena]|uniref:DUF5131 family protein n=1 Tax=Candidatus Magnetomonas plexicatena TaxID=2552947 RepID=UPI001C7429EF|nr:phage Gp37/Gp68 family protein [Nitrospirales bacterium LBB_01]